MTSYKEDIAPNIWRNGEIMPWEDATIHVGAVGHASVAGIFEGIKAYWNEDDKELYVLRLHEHMARFINSIKMVRYGFEYSIEDLDQAVLDLLRANEFKTDVYIRPYIFQKGMVRELLQAQPGKPTELVIDSWPFVSYEDIDKALHVCISSWTRISDNVLPPRLKCFSNYHNGRLAAIEANVHGFDWCVLLDAAGKVILPTITNGILESITRETIIRLLTDVLDIPVIEREVDRTELYIADEIFFLGTGWEIMPVASVERLDVGDGKIGPITKAVADIYHKVATAEDSRFPEWRTPVWNS
jgi:branched-chain amino acid aminotransferase